MMKVLLAVETPDNKIFEISEVVYDISWTTTLLEQPGKLKFSVPSNVELVLDFATTVNLMVDEVPVFYGYVVNMNCTEDTITYEAVDQMFYLKNKESYVFSGKTATQIFKAICDDWKFTYKIVDECNWQVSTRVHDGKSLYSIIAYGYDEALVNTQNWFIIRDNYGTLEQISLLSLKTNYYISDDLNVTNFNYRKSIDRDSYNRVKLVQDNTKEGVRKVYVAQDDENQRKWGILQYYEKVDKNATENQIKERGNALLKIKNRELKTIKIQCVGLPHNFRAGHWLFVALNPLTKAGFVNNQEYIVVDCTHRWKNNEHTISLNLNEYSLNVGG